MDVKSLDEETVNHVTNIRCLRNDIPVLPESEIIIMNAVRFQVLTAASMMFRAVFWVGHGSTTQKTALNIMNAAVSLDGMQY
jgi:hypothetical protein